MSVSTNEKILQLRGVFKPKSRKVSAISTQQCSIFSLKRNSIPSLMSFQDSCCRESVYAYRIGVNFPGLYIDLGMCTWMSVQNMIFQWS